MTGIASYLLLATLLALFFGAYFNRFLALRSGNGEFSGGVALLAGRLPYRDYFTAGPPLNVLKSALLLKLFGPALLVSRVAGAIERIIIGAILFRWLRQVTSARHALVAAILTVILSAGDSTDPIASYNHDALLWAILAGLASSLALQGSASRRRLRTFAVLAGFASALSVLTKQTVGLAVIASLLVAVPTLLPGRGWRPRLDWLLSFVVGCALPLAIVGVVLARLGVLASALNMLFVKGPAAKAGHPSDFLLRVGLVAWDNFGWLTLGTFALVLCWRPLQRPAELSAPLDLAPWRENQQPPGRFLLVVLLSGLGVLLTAEALRSFPALHDFTKSAVYFSSLALVAILLRLLLRLRSLQPIESQRLLFGVVSLAVSLALALSWPAFEAMLLPGFGLVIGLALQSARPSGRRWMYVALIFAAWMQLREKLDLPFAFNLQQEGPVRLATATSALPALHGLFLPPSTVAFVDAVVTLAKTRTTPAETIVTYPEMGLLYTLSMRNPPTFAASHNIDVVNDNFAREEVSRLLAAPPAIIVYYRLSEEDQRGAERLWRRSHPSGQRELVAAIETLIRSYRLVAAYRLTPGDPPIEVYLKD